MTKQQTAADLDGVYRYRWHSALGKHTSYFAVERGIIRQPETSPRTPVAAFYGRAIEEFLAARKMAGWRWEGDQLQRRVDGHQYQSMD